MWLFYYVIGVAALIIVGAHVSLRAFPERDYNGDIRNKNYQPLANKPLFVLMGAILALLAIFIWPLFVLWFFWHNRKHFSDTLKEFTDKKEDN